MRIHLIAIGGSAMHNIALALQSNHHTVTGSDDEIYNPAKDRLQAAGLLPSKEGWHPENISTAIDVVILGMHAHPDNPELARAQQLGLKIYSYPEFVFQQAKHQKRVVIAGSHGKTTTTSMIMHVLKYFNKDFDYLVGAQLDGFERMARFSNAPLTIIEGDEYLSSPIDRKPKFLHYRAHLAVITGIAWDHINVFPTFEAYKEQFLKFAQTMSPEGKLFYYQHDDYLSELLKEETVKVECIPYESFRYKIQHNQTFLYDKEGNTIPLSIFGKHNLENLKAAYHICRELGFSDADFFQAIPSFLGAAKRLDFLYKNEEAIAYKDFAHAPSKVKATTEAMKTQYPDRKLTACLELHTYSSLNKNFLPHYAQTLNAADEAYVFFKHHTLKMKRLPPINADEIQKAFQHPNLHVVEDKNEILKQKLAQSNWKARNLLLMTSGNFGGWDMKEISKKLLS